MTKVYCIGEGLVTPLGSTLEAVLDAAREGLSRRLFEKRGNLRRRITSNAAAYGGNKECQFGVLAGTFCEFLHSVGHRRLAFHSRKSVCASRQAFADTPFGTEILVGIPRGTATVHTLDVAAKYEYFILAQLGNAVGCNPMTINELSIFHSDNSFCKYSNFFSSGKTFYNNMQPKSLYSQNIL